MSLIEQFSPYPVEMKLFFFFWLDPLNALWEWIGQRFSRRNWATGSVKGPEFPEA
jgi:hypothetical protein